MGLPDTAGTPRRDRCTPRGHPIQLAERPTGACDPRRRHADRRRGGDRGRRARGRAERGHHARHARGLRRRLPRPAPVAGRQSRCFPPQSGGAGGPRRLRRSVAGSRGAGGRDRGTNRADQDGARRRDRLVEIGLVRHPRQRCHRHRCRCDRGWRCFLWRVRRGAGPRITAGGSRAAGRHLRCVRGRRVQLPAADGDHARGCGRPAPPVPTEARDERADAAAGRHPARRRVHRAHVPGDLRGADRRRHPAGAQPQANRRARAIAGRCRDSKPLPGWLRGLLPFRRGG